MIVTATFAVDRDSCYSRPAFQASAKQGFESGYGRELTSDELRYVSGAVHWVIVRVVVGGIWGAGSGLAAGHDGRQIVNDALAGAGLLLVLGAMGRRGG